MTTMNVYHGDLESITKTNRKYRKARFTGQQLQLVAMTLMPGEDIPEEVHDDHDQFIRVEKGLGKLLITRDGKTKTYELRDGVAVVIPAGAHHHVVNTSKKRALHLYTIYGPPEHPAGVSQRRQPKQR